MCIRDSHAARAHTPRLARRRRLAAVRSARIASGQTSKFGERLKDQVEERLRFYDTGETPRKNLDVMKEVMAELASDEEAAAAEPNAAKKGKKDKKDKEAKGGGAAVDDAAGKEKKKHKSEKKDKDDAGPEKKKKKKD